MKSKNKIGLNSNISPMMKQYLEIKNNHKDCILFFRMGDFYEMFFEDAILATAILGIVLTKRGNLNGEDIPMCGIPFHSYENYLHRLIKAGHKVALCEQTEKPEEAKKRGHKTVVNREVVRIITAGTLLEDNLIEDSYNNYLLCIHFFQKEASLAWVDISTGDFFVDIIHGSKVNDAIQSIAPKEILVSQEYIQNIFEDNKKLVTTLPNEKFSTYANNKAIQDYFNNNTQAFANLKSFEKVPCGVIVDYIHLTQKNILNITAPKRILSSDKMKIDIFTQKSLELTRAYSNRKEGSLLHAINRTCTSLGERNLYHWLLNPLSDIKQLNARLDVVEFFLNDVTLLEKLRNTLKSFTDIERSLSRICLNRASVLDIASIRSCLRFISEIRENFLRMDIPTLLEDLLCSFNYYGDLLHLLEKALINELSIEYKDAGFVKAGYKVELDEAKKTNKGIASKINDLQSEYIALLGLSILKVQYTSMAGYFIEVPSKHAPLLSRNNLFTHKQTLTNNVRYTTEDLMALEVQILRSNSKVKEYEQEVLQFLYAKIIHNKEKIYETAKAVANLDVLLSFAQISSQEDLVKPILENSKNLLIKEGRHLVVESSLKTNKKDSFVPNDCFMNLHKKIFLLTGPNMSGKSTFLRQNALIIIMAQIGCFVPAKEAIIGVVDALYSRVGASDDLFKGQSTFMVEMLELSSILNNATEKSFIILDEIGRGTATYDGLSIAWATLEYLNDVLKVRCLFATHYHELISLENSLSTVECYYVKIMEHKDDIIFMHTLLKGAVSKSYGIKVANIAGIPKRVIKRANEILISLEKDKKEYNLPLFSSAFNFTEKDSLENDSVESTKIVGVQEVQEPQADHLLAEHIIVSKVKAINLDSVTPREALDILYKLKSEIS